MRAKHCDYFTLARRIGSSVVIRTITFLAGSLLAASAVCAQPSDKPADNPYTAQYTSEGTTACLYCHDVERMRLIGKTPHGDKNNPNSPFAQHGCESCHGPGSLHATRSRRGRGRPPMIDYGINTSTPPEKQSQSCLKCHQNKMGEVDAMQWKGSVHATPWKDDAGKVHEMTCSNCHEEHADHDPMQDKQTQIKTCYSCHTKEEKEHPRFKDKAIAFDKLSCWDCHDVHQLIPQGR